MAIKTQQNKDDGNTSKCAKLANILEKSEVKLLGHRYAPLQDRYPEKFLLDLTPNLKRSIKELSQQKANN